VSGVYGASEGPRYVRFEGNYCGPKRIATVGDLAKLERSGWVAKERRTASTARRGSVLAVVCSWPGACFGASRPPRSSHRRHQDQAVAASGAARM